MRVIAATVLTGIVGEIVKKIIEKTLFHNAPHAQIEDLFGRLDLVAPALAVAGIVILIAGLAERRTEEKSLENTPDMTLGTGLDHWRSSGAMPAVSWILPLGRDYLDRYAGGRCPAACRGFQLRAGRGADASSGWA